MELMSKKLLDEKSWLLLQALQQNARTSYSDLARLVGLSVPAVVERIRRLEEEGIITGYRATVSLAPLGRPLKAVVRFQGTGTQMTQIADAVKSMPEVIQAYRMTGDACFMAVVAVASTSHLEAFLDSVSRYGQTQTSIVVSEPVEAWAVEQVK
jgi:Lrp/AsnC family leucine-responsive transcriptional regulator